MTIEHQTGPFVLEKESVEYYQAQSNNIGLSHFSTT